MRAGVFLAYWPWFTPAEQVELAVLADSLGLDSAWVAEAWGQDAVSVLGLLAGKTDRIGLGSGLMQIPARRATATAMAAVSLDVISEGRFRLGLGLSGPQVSEGWYGVPFTNNLRRTREYVDVVRRTLAREKMLVDMEGGEPGLGLGKPLKLLARPVQERLPIYLGSIGPKAVRQTGAIADGWLPFMLDPTEPELLLGPLREGAESAGRSLADIDIAPIVPLAIDENLDAARNAVRPGWPLPRVDGRQEQELLRRAGRAPGPRGRRARGPGEGPGRRPPRCCRGGDRRAGRRGRDRDDSGRAGRAAGDLRARGRHHAGGGAVR